LLEATSKLVRAATKLGEPVHILVLDENQQTIAGEAATLEGVEKVLYATHPNPDSLGFDQVASLLVSVMNDYQALIASASGRGRYVLPILAAKLGVPPLTGISAILGDGRFERPIYAGAALEQVRLEQDKTLLTIRTAPFTGVSWQAPCEIEKIATPPASGQIEIIACEQIQAERPDLASAVLVVSGGRGLGSRAGFARLENLADRLGAALGASRVAVDMGWAPHQLQVGQTGHQIAPRLYIAMGISGAVQHIAGIKDAGTIVAINSDVDAAIFTVADYGLAADINLVLPELIALLAE
jgi:electron transfer flavoprotein alpha subunit